MTTLPSSPMSPRSSRKTALGASACLVITCVVAPPVVRGASEAGAASDGGGCNGGRGVPIVDEDSETTNEEESSTSETSEPSTTTVEPGSCGDGAQDPGEACDDGNEVEEDGCPSGAKGACKGAASCGDGIVWAGEEACDDGNMDGGDGCEADCTVTSAECGNGEKEPGEGCDDGNDVEEDACPSGGAGQCKAAASCGDGFVWTGMEVCDDGNVDETDACPSGDVGQCLADASCGDGFTWAGMEGCDDGNMEDADACPSGVGACVEAAKCGDGYVEMGSEDCDDKNSEDLDGCNNACASSRWVFVTSGNGPSNNGNLGGIAGADGYCQTFATNAGLPGTYKAWLTGADPATAPATRFASTEFKGWYLLPSDPPTPVALGWADLTSPNADMPANYLQNAIHVDEGGSSIGDGSTWTNTNPDGTQNDPASHCGDWAKGMISNEGRQGLVSPGLVDSTWTSAAKLTCQNGARLYCFEVE